MKTLGEIGEDALIRRLLDGMPVPQARGEGPGDDCAVWDAGGADLALLKTDVLVEGVHFFPGTAGREVGWKAVARVASDFAAMAGRPDRYLVTLALPAATPLCWVEELYAGMADCMRTHGGVLAGGETSAVPAGSAAVINVAATGRVARGRVVLRSTGRPGDGLWVSGWLGGSLAGRHLSFPPRLEEAAWLAEHFPPTAMMDLSDGLAVDLPRLAAASGCGYRLDRQRVPVRHGETLEAALGDGEDFELLFSQPAGRAEELAQAWRERFPETPLHEIGVLTPPGEGDDLAPPGGWRHFQGNA
jgi:thiamine-monophosphate kinase